MIDHRRTASLVRQSSLGMGSIVLAIASTLAAAQVRPQSATLLTAPAGPLPAGTRLGGDGSRRIGGDGAARFDAAPPAPRAPALTPPIPASPFRALTEAIDQDLDPR